MGTHTPAIPVRKASVGAVVGSEYFDADQMAVADAVYAFYNGKNCAPTLYGNLLPRHAAAFVSQVRAETSFRYNAIGDDGAAHGPNQLHEDRLAKATGALYFPRQTTYSLEQWLEIAWADITSHAEVKGFHALELCLNATTAYDASVALTKKWERCLSHGQWDIRGKSATSWLVHYNPPS